MHRACATDDRGTTVVEMIVASMLLGVGILAVLVSLNTATHTTATADHRNSAVGVATTEIETVRSWPYEAVGISPASRGFRPRFESRSTVTAGTVRVEALSDTTIGGIDYSIRRDVTWESITVNAARIDEGYKVVTVVVTWTDRVGTHTVRQDTGLYRPDDDV